MKFYTTIPHRTLGGISGKFLLKKKEKHTNSLIYEIGIFYTVGKGD
jgi:hypothetical protein